MYDITTYKCRLVKDGIVSVPNTKLKDPYDAAALFFELLQCLPHEEIFVAYVNNQNEITGVERVSQGGAGGAAITCTEIFRGAIISGAMAIVMAHNHPSGDPTPSPHDLKFTKNVKDAAKIIGIDLLDHLVVCPERKTWRSCVELLTHRVTD
jgi:DNA repair protein RadC